MNCANRIVLAAALTPALLAQTAPPPTQPDVPYTEHYRKSTVCIGRILGEGNRRHFDIVGAGVLISPDKRHVVLVTAKHVFNEPEQGWHPSELRIRFSSQEDKSFSEELGVALPLATASGQNLWKALDDGSDLAAIDLPARGGFEQLITDAIGYQDFPTLEDVYDGATTFIFGYPTAASSLMRGDGLVRAITRSGIIAWTDPNGPMENPLLLDANILPGNSGGPAFRIPSGVARGGGLIAGGRVAFLGIVTADLKGYYSVMADGRIIQVKFPDLAVPSIEQVQVIGIGGLGKVEPAAKVKRLVDQIMSQ